VKNHALIFLFILQVINKKRLLFESGRIYKN